MEKENFKRLIKSISDRFDLTEQEISARLGYEPGYIAQIKSRGPISVRFIKLLEQEFPIDTVNEDDGYQTKISIEREGRDQAPWYIDVITKLTDTVASQQSTIYNLTAATGKTG